MKINLFFVFLFLIVSNGVNSKTGDASGAKISYADAKIQGKPVLEEIANKSKNIDGTISYFCPKLVFTNSSTINQLTGNSASGFSLGFQAQAFDGNNSVAGFEHHPVEDYNAGNLDRWIIQYGQVNGWYLTDHLLCKTGVLAKSLTDPIQTSHAGAFHEKTFREKILCKFLNNYNGVPDPIINGEVGFICKKNGIDR